MKDVTQDAHRSQVILLVFYSVGQMEGALLRGSELSVGRQSVHKCSNVPEI